MQDINLNKVSFIPASISKALRELDIRTARQLFARLRSQENELKAYLKLSILDFETLRQKLDNLISENFPEDLLPSIQPTVNKRGVAVHRLHDPTRPKYYTRKVSS